MLLPITFRPPHKIWGVDRAYPFPQDGGPKYRLGPHAVTIRIDFGCGRAIMHDLALPTTLFLPHESWEMQDDLMALLSPISSGPNLIRTKRVKGELWDCGYLFF